MYPTASNRTSGSSILVPAATAIQLRFQVQQTELVTLTTALYVLGLGAGPFVFAPISELCVSIPFSGHATRQELTLACNWHRYGRQISYMISMVGFTLLNLGCIFAPSYVTASLDLSRSSLTLLDAQLAVAHCSTIVSRPCLIIHARIILTSF